MAKNLLHRAEIFNSTDTVGLPRKELSRDELMVVAGLRNGSITVPSLTYVCFEVNLNNPFYAKDFTLNISEGTCLGFAYFQSDIYHSWKQIIVDKPDSNRLYVDFNKVLPDHAQILHKFRFVYVNVTQVPTQIYGGELLAVDYPIEFDYQQFSVVATSHENSPLKVFNESVQESEQDIRILPIYSGDYEHDSVYMITASGKYDDDRYHIQRGWRFPEDAGWNAGRIQNIDNPDYPYWSDGATNTGTLSYVPAMTSWYTPEPFYAEASDEYGAVFGEAYRPFDGANGIWSSSPSPPPGYLRIHLDKPTVINRYNIKKSNASDNPKSWEIYGSNDKESWTLLHSVEDFSWAGVADFAYPADYFNFINGYAYLWYMIKILDTWAATPTRCLLCSWKLIEAIPNSSAPDTIPSLTASGRELVLGDTLVSGTWTSPVVYLPDEDLITMYVYGDNLSDDAYITKDLRKIDSLVEVRASDQSPRPNFLVSSWTPRLFTHQGEKYQQTLSMPARRHGYVGIQEAVDSKSSFWAAEKTVCAPLGRQSPPCPFSLGRSKRMYIKGDGSVIAQAPLESDSGTIWEYGHRGYQQGIPFKEFGDINEYWNAGHLIPLLGSFIPYETGSCGINHKAAPALWHRMTFASELDQSDWAQGRAAWSKLKYVYPYYGHFSERFSFGACLESLSFEPLGSYTFARAGHPNEWLNVTGIMYPWGVSSPKYMCLYYTHVRNFWPSESKLLGIYGIGKNPCDEGWAMCKSDNGGFWLHVGYASRIMKRYDDEGDLVFSGRCNYSFNAICETSDPDGLWCLRNDAAYWYSFDGEQLVEEFVVTNSAFKYLQHGGIDVFNNLWVIDRDSSTIYRINFSSRSIDYEKEVPYTVGVWPHPRDGTAFLYSSFNAATFSTAINHIDMNDPHGYVEQISVLPELPISDYSGVQFMGKAMESYLNPAINDPIWGTADDLTLDWGTYPNASLTLPGGKYKQFRITLSRSNVDKQSPQLQKVRIPKSMVLSNVPYQEGREVYINPHLRYNTKVGHFNTELVVWWPH